MTCDLHETTFATTTDNGDTRKKTKKDIRKYNNNNNNICLFPTFADFSELQVGSGKALTNIQL